MLDTKYSSCENILLLLKEIIKNYLKESENMQDDENTLTTIDMEKALVLCDKLLLDYFSESEAFVDSCKDTFLLDAELQDTWYKMYTEELKQKQKDLDELFYYIVKNIEEI